MASGITMQLTGVDEFGSALTSIADGMKRRVLKRAVAKGSQVLVGPVRSATPKSKKKFGKAAAKNPSGTTRKSTGRIARTYKGGAIQAGYVGHRWPKGAAAHLVDQGTTDRFRKGRRRGYSGFVAPRKFFEQAVNPKRELVMSTMQHELSAGLEIERQKALTKAMKKSGAKV